MPLVEKYWGGWKRSDRGTQGGDPERAAAHPGPVRARAVGQRHAAARDRRLPGPGVRRERRRTTAADRILSALFFGRTSELYKKLVVAEQKVDELDVDTPTGVDPSLFTVLARVKKPEDAVYVRDQILATIARRADLYAVGQAPRRREVVQPLRVRADARQHRANRIRASRATSSYRRSFATVNAFYRTLDTVTAADVQAAARKYFTDAGLIVTTLAKTPLPGGDSSTRLTRRCNTVATPREARAAATPAVSGGRLCVSAEARAPIVLQKSVLPQLDVKLLFSVGSAHDPAGKEGLAALTAAMITEAGSTAMTIEQIEKALYPIAGSFSRPDRQGDDDRSPRASTATTGSGSSRSCCRNCWSPASGPRTSTA